MEIGLETIGREACGYGNDMTPGQPREATSIGAGNEKRLSPVLDGEHKTDKSRNGSIAEQVDFWEINRYDGGLL